MDRRQFLRKTVSGVFALSFTGCTGQKRKVNNKHPNIIFIMTDDMGYGDAKCYNPECKIPSPNIDQLAREGVRFTDAHSPSAVCTPTRYSVLTGRYCWRSRLKRGVFGGFNRPLIENGRMTVASLLKKHGYSTACIGKWHLGLNWTLKQGVDPENQEQMTVDFTGPISGGPNELGFDYFFGTAGCTTDDPPLCFIKNNYTVGIPNILSPEDPADEDRELLMVPGWRHEDADIEYCNQAVRFIKDHVKQKPDSPFFVYLPLSVPHIPWFPPELTKGKSKAGPRGDQVVLADWILGQITKILDELKMSENTLLFFTSDNGPREGVNGHKSAGNLRGLKGGIWEGGHRVPFIARWPKKIRPGTVCHETIGLMDLMATCAAIVGEQLPDNAGEDSYNILPVLVGEKYPKPIREATVHHSGGGVFAIRQGDWKLIEGTKSHGGDMGPDPDKPGQLYNLKDDPFEKIDLWDQRPEKVRKLLVLLNSYRDQGYSRPL